MPLWPPDKGKDGFTPDMDVLENICINENRQIMATQPSCHLTAASLHLSTYATLGLGLRGKRESQPSQLPRNPWQRPFALRNLWCWRKWGSTLSWDILSPIFTGTCWLASWSPLTLEHGALPSAWIGVQFSTNQPPTTERLGWWRNNFLVCFTLR